MSKSALRFSPAGLLGLILAFGLSGCSKELTRTEFLKEYEKRAAVISETDAYRFVSVYQSPEYMAAQQGEEGLGARTIDSLKKEYGNGIYVRLSVRVRVSQKDFDTSSWQPKDPILMQALLAQQLERVQATLAGNAYLLAPDGRKVHPLSNSFHGGLRTGSANSFLLVFPLEDQGRALDPVKSQLMIEDFGLNTGTLRQRLVLPKGIRLKVAA